MGLESIVSWILRQKIMRREGVAARGPLDVVYEGSLSDT